MKKLFIFLIVTLITPFCMPTPIAHAENLPHYEICANYANVYEETSLNSNVLAILKNKTQVAPELEGGSAKMFEGAEFSFYKVSTGSVTGYVLCDFVALKKVTIENIPTFNAKTKNKTVVFEKVENGFEESDIALEKHTNIFLYKGFDSKNFNAVAFVYDNEVHYGYIHADDISPNGINPIIITCISLIIALIGIIFALVFMRHKKVKLKKVGTKS